MERKKRCLGLAVSLKDKILQKKRTRWVPARGKAAGSPVVAWRIIFTNFSSGIFWEGRGRSKGIEATRIT